MKTHRTLIEDAVSAYLEESGRTSGKPLFPVISDREAWDSLDDEVKAGLIRTGEETAGSPWPMLLLTDYLDFNRTGNRVRFEDKYFGRRIRLTKLVMAECAENRGRFLDEILNGIYLILEESAWCLPAHNSHIRDGRMLPLPDACEPIIDLFAAETAALLGLAEYLLRPVLKPENAMLCTYLNAELRRRIIVPYLNEHFWWMGDGVTRMMNWTPWITQNVLIAVSTRPETGVLSDEERAQIFRQAAFSADCFVDSYGEDGCCEEGAQYYGHAGLCLFGCLDLFNRITGGAVKSCFREPVIRNMAAYIVRMYVGNQYYINFADCSAFPGHRSAREFLFGRMTDNPAMSDFAAADYRQQDEQERLLPNEQNLYYHVLQAFAHREMMQAQSGSGQTQPEDFWFESTQVLVARDGKYTLAAKGGNNAEAHNHNDIGTVTVYKDAQPVLIDLGVETYTRETFSEKRYGIWTMQSQYHSLPTFEAAEGPVQQKPGEAYKAADVRCAMSEQEAKVRMELAGAYDHPGVTSYVREVCLKKGEGVQLHDVYEGNLPCTLSLMTYEKPVAEQEPEKDCFTIRVGELAQIRLRGVSSVAVEECPITDARLGIVWKHSCWRILADMAEKEIHAVIS